MTTTVEATYENRKLVLSQPLPLPEKAHVRVTVETSDIMELLTPLIPELGENTCSLRKFYNEHVYLLKKVRKSGRPLVLWKESGPVALILDPENYVVLERRRQNITDILSRMPEKPILGQVWPSVGKRQINALDRIVKRIERLKNNIEHYEEMRKPIAELQQKAQKELGELEKQKNKHLSELGKKE